MFIQHIFNRGKFTNYIYIDKKRWVGRPKIQMNTVFIARACSMMIYLQKRLHLVTDTENKRQAGNTRIKKEQ